jgi:hypothetical protein
LQHPQGIEQALESRWSQDAIGRQRVPFSSWASMAKNSSLSRSACCNESCAACVHECRYRFPSHRMMAPLLVTHSARRVNVRGNTVLRMAQPVLNP